MIDISILKTELIDWDYLQKSIGYSTPDDDFLRLINKIDLEFCPSLSYFYDAKTTKKNIFEFLTSSVLQIYEFHPLINFDHIRIQTELPHNNLELVKMILAGKLIPNFYITDWWIEQLKNKRQIKDMLREILVNFQHKPNKYLHPFDLNIYSEDFPQVKALSTYDKLNSLQKIGDFGGRNFINGFESKKVRSLLRLIKSNDLYPHRQLAIVSLKLKKSISDLLRDLEALQKKVGLKEKKINNIEFERLLSGSLESFIAKGQFNGPLVSKKSLPSVTALIPFFKGEEILVNLIKSLKKQGYKKLDIVVLCDDPKFSPVSTISGVTYVKNSSNYGFLRNVNNGIKYAKGDYIFLLNSDIELVDECLYQLASVSKYINDKDIISPILLYPNGYLQEAGGNVSSSGEITNLGYGIKLKPSKNQGIRFHEVDHVSGAALFFKNTKKEIFNDAYHPAYCEDLDFCFETRKSGGKVYSVTTAYAYHTLSASYGNSGLDHLKKLTLINKNIEIFSRNWKNELSNINKVDVIAMYLPQFHSDQINNKVWGLGFTEWNQIAKCNSIVSGQAAPLIPSTLGFYNLEDFKSMLSQWEIAKKYGVNGFCLYHYRFSHKEVALTIPLENLIKNNSDIRFMLCWANENWTKSWDGLESEVILKQDYSLDTLRSFAQDFKIALKCKNYIRNSEGRPLLSIYRMSPLKDLKLIEEFKKILFDVTGENPLLMGMLSMDLANRDVFSNEYKDVDYWIEFPPQGFGVRKEQKINAANGEPFKGFVYDYEETIKKQISTLPSTKIIPGCFTDWDNTPRRGNSSTFFLGSTATLFTGYLESQIQKARYFLPPNQRYVFINAWNEWAESAVLEPNQSNQYSYLQAVLLAKKNLGIL